MEAYYLTYAPRVRSEEGGEEHSHLGTPGNIG